MESREEIDQFQLLEEKINSLISLVTSLRDEKKALIEKIDIQEEKIADISRQMETIKTSGDKVKQRIAALLERIELLDF